METFLPFFCNVRHNNSLLENNKIEQLKGTSGLCVRFLKNVDG